MDLGSLVLPVLPQPVLVTTASAATLAAAAAAAAAAATVLALEPCVEQLLRPRTHESAHGHSVFTVPLFASAPECDALIGSANRLLASYGDRTPQPERCRLSIVSKVEAVLLRRLLELVETRLPELAERQFGQRTGLAAMKIEYSPGEPAVNVYLKGGCFAPHTDKQALTILVPLSPAGSFEGGGTAFWRDAHHAPRAAEDDEASPTLDPGDPSGWLPHDLVVRAPQGTGIIFCGDVTHSGLPVTEGVRHLFVMSFSLRPRPASAPEDARPQQIEDDEIWPDDDGGALDALADFADLLGTR